MGIIGLPAEAGLYAARRDFSMPSFCSTTARRALISSIDVLAVLNFAEQFLAESFKIRFRDHHVGNSLHVVPDFPQFYPGRHFLADLTNVIFGRHVSADGKQIVLNGSEEAIERSWLLFWF